jgi:hypothetical protein
MVGGSDQLHIHNKSTFYFAHAFGIPKVACFEWDILQVHEGIQMHLCCKGTEVQMSTLDSGVAASSDCIHR